ncbi:MAG: phage tail protein [Candidatus Parvarchaeum sp.]
MSDLQTLYTPFAGQYGPTLIVASSTGAPLPNTSVTVYIGTSSSGTLATLYTDQTRANTLANPVTTDSNGNLLFFADPGQYTLSFSNGSTQINYTVMVSPWFNTSVWNAIDVTANYSANPGDHVLCNAGTGQIAITLPQLSPGMCIRVTKTDTSANEVQIFTASGQYIQGLGLLPNTYGASATPLSLTLQSRTVELHAGSDVWHIVSGGADVGFSSIPVGTILDYGGPTAPYGWFLCDGGSYSTASYPSLYAVIGNYFTPSGTASGTFCVPNLVGYVSVGAGSGATIPGSSYPVSLSNTGGEGSHLLLDTESGVPSTLTLSDETEQHVHGGIGEYLESTTGPYYTVVYGTSGTNLMTALNTTGETGAETSGHTHTATGASAASPHNNVQPYVAIYKIIKW